MEWKKEKITWNFVFDCKIYSSRAIRCFWKYLTLNVMTCNLANIYNILLNSLFQINKIKISLKLPKFIKVILLAKFIKKSFFWKFSY